MLVPDTPPFSHSAQATSPAASHPGPTWLSPLLAQYPHGQTHQPTSSILGRPATATVKHIQLEVAATGLLQHQPAGVLQPTLIASAQQAAAGGIGGARASQQNAATDAHASSSNQGHHSGAVQQATVTTSTFRQPAIGHAQKQFPALVQANCQQASTVTEQQQQHQQQVAAVTSSSSSQAPASVKKGKFSRLRLQPRAAVCGPSRSPSPDTETVAAPCHTTLSSVPPFAHPVQTAHPVQAAHKVEPVSGASVPAESVQARGSGGLLQAGQLKTGPNEAFSPAPGPMPANSGQNEVGQLEANQATSPEAHVEQAAQAKVHQGTAGLSPVQSWRSEPPKQEQLQPSSLLHAHAAAAQHLPDIAPSAASEARGDISPFQRSAAATIKHNCDITEQRGSRSGKVASMVYKSQQPICQAASARRQAACDAEQKAHSLPPPASPSCADQHGVHMGQTQHGVNMGPIQHGVKMGHMQCGAGQHSQSIMLAPAHSNKSSSAGTANKETTEKNSRIKSGDSNVEQPLQAAVGTAEHGIAAEGCARELSQVDLDGTFADDWDWQQTQGICGFHDAYQPSQALVSHSRKSPVRQGTSWKGLDVKSGKQPLIVDSILVL